MPRAFSTCHPDRDLPAASEAVSLLIEVDLQGPFPASKCLKSHITVATGVLPYKEIRVDDLGGIS